MTTPTTTYGSASVSDLRARTEYEAWLLEAVYEIVDQPLVVHNGDELIYPPDGAAPALTIYFRTNLIIGDWRPGFLKAGAPLVLVTVFKLLDMFLEWVLSENGQRATHRFVQKVGALKAAAVRFPPIVESRSWLRERLIALYENLEPLRGTIIHARHFKTSGGALQVSGSKGGIIGAAVTISATDLQNLALVLVSLLRYLEGTWTIDLFQEKRVRRTLDELAHLHGLSRLGQLPPGFLTVRIYVPGKDPIRWDIQRILRDVAAKREGQDVIVNLRIIVISHEGGSVTAYLIPWDQLRISISGTGKARAELSR